MNGWCLYSIWKLCVINWLVYRGWNLNHEAAKKGMTRHVSILRGGLSGTRAACELIQHQSSIALFSYLGCDLLQKDSHLALLLYKKIPNGITVKWNIPLEISSKPRCSNVSRTCPLYNSIWFYELLQGEKKNRGLEFESWLVWYERRRDR